MIISRKKEIITLFLGDILLLFVSLWLTLFMRYLEIPSRELFLSHILPFSILFAIWVVVFFIAGLYEREATVFQRKLPSLLLNSFLVNAVTAVLFFYFIPSFGINPKTNLFIYLVISFTLLLLWRLRGIAFLGRSDEEGALLLAGGSEAEELKEAINKNNRYGFRFVSAMNPGNNDAISEEKVLEKIKNVTSVVADLKNERILSILPNLRASLPEDIRVMDFNDVYEEVFERIPLSFLSNNSYIEKIIRPTHVGYDLLKRSMDISISFILGIISLILYPFVWLSVKIEDGGPAFIVQERIGEGNNIRKLLKFRSMKSSDKGEWLKEDDSRVTKVGSFLRKSRIDELPQLWNVLKGDISLIGPRPDIIGLGEKLAKEINNYTVRNMIKPGLSGWAQIKQELPPQSLEETKLRLSYDLYYLKNRSFVLDLNIALKTIKTLFSRSGK